MKFTLLHLCRVMIATVDEAILAWNYAWHPMTTSQAELRWHLRTACSMQWSTVIWVMPDRWQLAVTQYALRKRSDRSGESKAPSLCLVYAFASIRAVYLSLLSQEAGHDNDLWWCLKDKMFITVISHCALRLNYQRKTLNVKAIPFSNSWKRVCPVQLFLTVDMSQMQSTYLRDNLIKFMSAECVKKAVNFATLYICHCPMLTTRRRCSIFLFYFCLTPIRVWVKVASLIWDLNGICTIVLLQYLVGPTVLTVSCW